MLNLAITCRTIYNDSVKHSDLQVRQCKDGNCRVKLFCLSAFTCFESCCSWFRSDLPIQNPLP